MSRTCTAKWRGVRKREALEFGSRTKEKAGRKYDEVTQRKFRVIRLMFVLVFCFLHSTLRTFFRRVWGKEFPQNPCALSTHLPPQTRTFVRRN